MRNMLTGVIILVVIAVGVFVVMQFTGNDSGGVSDTSVTGADNAAGATATTSSAVTPGPFNPVTIDDDFHARLATALHQVNEAWTVAGTDCYIYRYGVFERLEGTQSQQITITGYIGGTAAQGLTPGGDEAFQESLAGYLDTFIMRGITVNVYLEFTNGEETPSLSDRYIKYGYYYALEHWDTLGAIVDALEGLKQANGQYPHALTESIVRPKIHTYGGLNFIAKGFGYLPLYKTGSDGYIIMGQGKGVASYYPEECAGYVLVMYLKTEKIGLDLFDPAGLNYYRENITPFPYEPKKKLTNMPLEPDDEPDGIACVIISGEIQDN